MTDPAALRARLEQGRESITALRDGAREGGLTFRIRDGHVSRLHQLVDDAIAFLDAAAEREQEIEKLLTEAVEDNKRIYALETRADAVASERKALKAEVASLTARIGELELRISRQVQANCELLALHNERFAALQKAEARVRELENRAS